MRLKQNLINILIPIYHPLFLLRQMQFPIHEHGIRVRNRRLQIFTVDIIDSQYRSRYADQIYEVRK